MKKKIRWYKRTLLVNYSLQIMIIAYSLILALWVTLANFFYYGLISGSAKFSVSGLLSIDSKVDSIAFGFTAFKFKILGESTAIFRH